MQRSDDMQPEPYRGKVKNNHQALKASANSFLRNTIYINGAKTKNVGV